MILLAGQILVACSQGGTNQAGGLVDLTVWINPAASEAGSLPANSELYKVIREKLNINLKLTLLPSGTDGTTKMNAAAAANNLPDLFQVLSNDLVLKWIDLGLVAPVNSLLPMMPGRTKDRYSNADLNKLYTVNGQLHVLQEPAQLTRRQGVFIRKDWLDKLGLQPPKTLDELLAVARAFTTRDPDGNGKNDTYGFGTLIEEGIGLGSRFNFIYGAYGISDVWDHSAPDKIALSVRKPGYLAATQFIRKMVEEKVIDPDWTTLNKDEFRARWKQGKYGIMTEDFCAAICQANYKPFDENFPNAEFALIDPPKGLNGDASLGSFVNAGNQLAVSKKAMDAGKGPAIARLLEWLNSGEGYYLAAFGQEGVNYKKDAQGNIVTTGVSAPYTQNPGRLAVQIRNLSLNGSPGELKLRYPDHKTKNGRTIQPLQVYNSIAAMPWTDATSTYVIKPAANQADINRYISENLVQFILGQKPLDEGSWNAFIKGLDGLGVADWEQSATDQLKARGFLK